MADARNTENVEQPLSTPGLASELESDRFKQFLDHAPVAIAVAKLSPSEAITYCNLEFERITGKSAVEIEGQDWKVLTGVASALDDNTSLGEAIVDEEEYVGTFTMDCGDRKIEVEAWSNTIASKEGVPVFRLVALTAIGRWRRSAGGR